MVRSIKEEHRIKCRRHKRFKVTTDSNHNKLIYPNLLDQKFDANRPNLALLRVSDIKNKRPRQGLIAHSDRGSQYCSHAYHKIIEQHEFKGSMSRCGNCFDNAPIESFSGEEHCSARRNELVYHQDYKTRFSAISDIIGYIELYYNEERLSKHCFAATQGKSCARSGTKIQKGLGYKSPRQVWFDFYRQAA